MTQLQTFQIAGWAEYNTEGIPNLYFTVTDEPFTTQSDTPANTQFVAGIKNALDFSIKRAPTSWIFGRAGIQGAAYGQLQLDNFKGQYQFLLKADLRDATLTIAFPAASSLMPVNAVSGAMLICTAIIDEIYSDDEDTITITLKDTIARFDRNMACRMYPPYVDASSANTMVPQLYGAGRNISGKYVDSANNIIQISDAPVSNITSVTDKGAPLDPNANPPQYNPALNGAGVQLNQSAVGAVHIDASSVGAQATIPGNQDILNGAGTFPGSPSATQWLGPLNNTEAVISTSSVSTLTAPARWTWTVSAGTNFTVGDQIKITDGTNSIYAQISAKVSNTLTVLQAGATTTGTPTSITAGASCTIVGAPTGFAWAGAATTLSRDAAANNAAFGTNNAVRLISSTVFYPTISSYGTPFKVQQVLLPGRSYRVTFNLYNVQTSPPGTIGGFAGGLLLAISPSSSGALGTTGTQWITGQTNPIRTSVFASQSVSYEFTVPANYGNQFLYFVVAPATSNVITIATGQCSLEIFNPKIELLGTYTQLPLSGIPYDQFLTELLVTRNGESSAVFNQAEAAAVGLRSDGSLMPMGLYFATQDNLLNCIRYMPDSNGVVVFTDSAGVLRFRYIVDPSNPTGRVVKAVFDETNVEKPVKARDSNPSGLSTLWGCRRNWNPFSAVSDFVTDTNIVTKGVQQQYMRTSQIQVQSSKSPAGSYNFAIGAPIYDTVFDLQADCQAVADRMVGIFSPTVYSDGSYCNGKRTDYTFTAFWDDPAALGVSTTIAVNQLMYGDIIQFSYAPKGIGVTYMMVKEWEIFPFAKKIVITGMA